MNKIIISLNNISKIFETDTVQTHALQKVNLEINQGDYISITGSSGCGKSTLLSILGLLDTASAGEYLFEGKDITGLTLDESAEIRNTKMGFVFQSFNLIDELSVFDNIALPLTYSPKPFKKEDVRIRVEECLNLVEMSHRSEHYPNQLSGGQQQRISIARALVNEPAILFVDEPTGNLDSSNSKLIMEMLEQLNSQGTTICFVTHDAVFTKMANRHLHLIDGQIFNNGEICLD